MESNQRDDNNTSDTGRFTRTAVLRKEFGNAWEIWLWVRHQFTPSSVGVIVTILGVAATYIIHLSDRVGRQQTHITVLQTQVVPLLKQNDKIVEMLSNVRVLVQRLTNIDTRMERLEAARDQVFQDTLRINELDERVSRLEVQQDRAAMEAHKPVSHFMRRSHK